METLYTDSSRTLIKPGRHSFENSGLKSHAINLLSTLVREQLTQHDYLVMRSACEESTAWSKATSTARREFFAFLRGAVEMLFVTEQIAWFHRVNAEWVCSPAQKLRQGPNAERSAIDYSKVDPKLLGFFGSSRKNPGLSESKRRFERRTFRAAHSQTVSLGFGPTRKGLRNDVQLEG